MEGLSTFTDMFHPHILAPISTGKIIVAHPKPFIPSPNRPRLGHDQPPAEQSAVEELWMEVSGSQMRYLKAPGPVGAPASPLLMIHGLWGFSYSWRKNIPSLSRHRTVYAVDMIGAGYSQRPSPRQTFDWSLKGHALRLLEFIDHLGIPTINLAASSHGGAIAMMLAILCRQRNEGQPTLEGDHRQEHYPPPAARQKNQTTIRKMALVSPVNPWSRYHPSIVKVAENILGRAVVRLAKPLASPICQWRLGKLYAVESRMTPGTAAAYAAPLNLPRSSQTQIGILRAWRQDEEELKHLLPTISNIPVLFIWGSEDRVIELSASSELIKNFKNAKVITIKSTGHLPYEELPAEFNPALESFLKEQDFCN